MQTIDRTTGQPLSRSARLKQSVQTILSTPKGHCVMRRSFGSRLPELVDAPVTPTWIALAFAESADAIARWEPDITVTGFEVTSNQAGRVTISIQYVDALSGAPLALEGITLNA